MCEKAHLPNRTDQNLFYRFAFFILGEGQAQAVTTWANFFCQDTRERRFATRFRRTIVADVVHGEAREKYYNDIYEPHCSDLYNRLCYGRGAHIWRATNFEPNLYTYKNYNLGRGARHPCRHRAGFYHVINYWERPCYEGQRLDYHARMR